MTDAVRWRDTRPLPLPSPFNNFYFDYSPFEWTALATWSGRFFPRDLHVRSIYPLRPPPPLLGNVVISKKFLRTRKIMVMHSNERGECHPHTLVDRKRKRYDNAVDVVVRLHDLTDPGTVTPAPPSS